MSKKITIIPRNKQILVLVDPEADRESEHGIITPDEVEQERKAIGTVEAVGPDVKGVEVGARVIYGAYAGEIVKLNTDKGKVEYRIFPDEDVIAFIKNKK